jgi:hypothetical protein
VALGGPVAVTSASRVETLRTPQVVKSGHLWPRSIATPPTDAEERGVASQAKSSNAVQTSPSGWDSMVLGTAKAGQVRSLSARQRLCCISAATIDRQRTIPQTGADAVTRVLVETASFLTGVVQHLKS